MSFAAALSQLASLSVVGVLHNYDISSVPDTPQRAQLPALLVLPLSLDDQKSTFQRETGKAFETIAFSAGPKTVRYITTHLLLVAPSAQGKGLRAHLPLMVSIIDAYFAALKDVPTLGDLLWEPAKVRVDPGVFPINGQDFYGCAFRHSWLIEA